MERTDHAACVHASQHFDRSLCACGVMHTYCNDCGEQLDACDEEPAASRYDNPDQWVSGGHEKFETPVTPAATKREEA